MQLDSDSIMNIQSYILTEFKDGDTDIDSIYEKILSGYFVPPFILDIIDNLYIRGSRTLIRLYIKDLIGHLNSDNTRRVLPSINRLYNVYFGLLNRPDCESSIIGKMCTDDAYVEQLNYFLDKNCSNKSTVYYLHDLLIIAVRHKSIEIAKSLIEHFVRSVNIMKLVMNDYNGILLEVAMAHENVEFAEYFFGIFGIANLFKYKSIINRALIFAIFRQSTDIVQYIIDKFGYTNSDITFERINGNNISKNPAIANELGKWGNKRTIEYIIRKCSLTIEKNKDIFEILIYYAVLRNNHNIFDFLLDEIETIEKLDKKFVEKIVKIANDNGRSIAGYIKKVVDRSNLKK